MEKGPHTEPSGGLEEGKKVSYWFSFNRNDRVIKYGKGYTMEETTKLTQKFPFPETEEDPDPWEFIFRPDTTKEIVIKDVEELESWQCLKIQHSVQSSSVCHRLTCTMGLPEHFRKFAKLIK